MQGNYEPRIARSNRFLWKPYFSQLFSDQGRRATIPRAFLSRNFAGGVAGNSGRSVYSTIHLPWLMSAVLSPSFCHPYRHSNCTAIACAPCASRDPGTCCRAQAPRTATLLCGTRTWARKTTIRPKRRTFSLCSVEWELAQWNFFCGDSGATY